MREKDERNRRARTRGRRREREIRGGENVLDMTAVVTTIMIFQLHGAYTEVGSKQAVVKLELHRGWFKCTERLKKKLGYSAGRKHARSIENGSRWLLTYNVL